MNKRDGLIPYTIQVKEGQKYSRHSLIRFDDGKEMIIKSIIDVFVRDGKTYMKGHGRYLRSNKDQRIL
jgi:hypothetical protein